MRGGRNNTGPWIEGLLDADAISNSAIAQRTGIHESTISRLINGVKPFTDKQLVQIGIGIGEVRAERRRRQSSQTKAA